MHRKTMLLGHTDRESIRRTQLITLAFHLSVAQPHSLVDRKVQAVKDLQFHLGINQVH